MSQIGLNGGGSGSRLYWRSLRARRALPSPAAVKKPAIQPRSRTRPAVWLRPRLPASQTSRTPRPTVPSSRTSSARRSSPPRSTFSADVSTASYSNVRRFIEQENKLPPKDAVLLAELVNYFPYRYPAPVGDNPVSLTTDLAPCPWKPEHKLARIAIRAKVAQPRRHARPQPRLPHRHLRFNGRRPTGCRSSRRRCTCSSTS